MRNHQSDNFQKSHHLRVTLDQEFGITGPTKAGGCDGGRPPTKPVLSTPHAQPASFYVAVFAFYTLVHNTPYKAAPTTAGWLAG